MDNSLRKRNASDGDSGFDSALSSRSSSICLEESPELNDFKISKVEEHTPPVSSLQDKEAELNSKFKHILDNNEVIFKDESSDGLYIIRDSNTGRETQYKPPGRIRFDAGPPQVEETYSKADYDRAVSVSRAHLFNSRLQLELEKQVAQMQLLEIDLLMDRTQVPPPSLGIRIIGVNMIHGVPDKLNIYVKKVMPDSVAGRDARIRVDDHIVEVNGVSLVGVSQKLAADTLSSCMVNPETGVVHFVLARQPEPEANESGDTVSELPKQKMTDGRVKPLAPRRLTRKDSLSTDDESLSPPGSPAIAHSGTSEAFIPCGDDPSSSNNSSGSSSTVYRISSEKVAPSTNCAAINLSELPVPGLLKNICPYLESKEDRSSLATALNKSFLPPAAPSSSTHTATPSPASSSSTRDIMKISKDSLVTARSVVPADHTITSSVTASEKCAIIVGDTNNNNATADVVVLAAAADKKVLKPAEHRRGILLNAIQKPVVPCI